MLSWNKRTCSCLCIYCRNCSHISCIHLPQNIILPLSLSYPCMEGAALVSSSLGLLTLFFIIGIGSTQSYRAQAHFDVIRLLELCCRIGQYDGIASNICIQCIIGTYLIRLPFLLMQIHYCNSLPLLDGSERRRCFYT